MKNDKQDVQPSKACRFKHKYQWVKKDKKGHLWQYCTGCDRKLLVR